MKYTLQLVFITDNDKTYTINIDNPVHPPVEADILDCADTIVHSDIFLSKNGSIRSFKGAYLTQKSEVVLA